MSRLKAVLDWLVPDDEPDVDDVDTEFLLSNPQRYKYMTITDTEPPRCRCDLCGAQYPLGDFDELVEHVADHDGHGAAEIDPFDEAEDRTVITDDLLEEVDEWRRDNTRQEEGR
jgi:hypothetical protein